MPSRETCKKLTLKLQYAEAKKPKSYASFEKAQASPVFQKAFIRLMQKKKKKICLKVLKKRCELLARMMIDVCFFLFEAYSLVPFHPILNMTTLKSTKKVLRLQPLVKIWDLCLFFSEVQALKHFSLVASLR